VGLNVEGLEGDPVVEEGKYYTHIEEFPLVVVSTVWYDIAWPNGHSFRIDNTDNFFLGHISICYCVSLFLYFWKEVCTVQQEIGAGLEVDVGMAHKKQVEAVIVWQEEEEEPAETFV